jgi:predicted Zn-dependent protease
LIDVAALAKEVADGRKNPNFTHARNPIRLAQVRLVTGSHREAEADFRECLDVLRRIERDNGWVWLANALLGECLTKQNRYAEAEEVLLACYADMTRRAG